MFNDNWIPLRINIKKLKEDHTPKTKLRIAKLKFTLFFELFIIDNKEHAKQTSVVIRDETAYIPEDSKIIFYSSLSFLMILYNLLELIFFIFF